MGFDRWLQTVPLRLRSLFRRRQVEQELDEELQYHLDRLTEEAVAAGRSPEEARYAALRAMRGLEQRKEDCRDTWRFTVAHDMLQDLRYAVRALRRTPTVAGVMVLSLALGIGVNVALFGVLEQALLRPPTAVRPDRLVEVELGGARQVSFPELLDLAKSGIGATAAYTDSQESGRWSGVGETVHCRLVTFNYFDLLGARATWGRTFAESESAAGGHVAVLAHRFWELRMASDPRALGAPIFVNGEAFTVVGVLPRDFLPVTGPVEAPEIYLPLSPTLPGGLDDRGRRLLFPLLRLPDGMTHRQAESALATVAARFEREAPMDEPRDSRAVRVTGVDTAARLSRHKPELWMVCGAVLVMSVLILCIACANVSSVLLARGVARRREIALRLAIGASRGRLVRQLAAETLVVALLASVIALALHAATIGLINHALAHSREAVPFAAVPGGRLLLYGLGVALVTTLLAGLWPALQATRPALVPALKVDAAAASLSPSRMRRALVAGQVAASFVLLAVAALFVRSLLVTSRQGLGFDVENTLVAHVNLPRERYEGREPQFFEEAVAKVRALPDVDSASRTALVPLSFATTGAAVALEGEAPQAATYTSLNVVGPRYFHILGIPVVAGREFDDGDREGAAAAVVVNHAFVRHRIPEGPAIGRRLTVRDGRGQIAATVVGVVGDAKYLWPGEEPRPQVYLSALQPQGIRRVRAIVARTVTPPASTVPALRRALEALEPLAEVRVTTLRDHVDPAFWPSRLAAGVLGAMGALGMLLATIGLFGVMSYAVTSRRQEIGVRMALGATRARVLGTVLRSGLTLVGLGGLAGLGLSLIAPRPLAPFLAAGVTPTDPWSLAAVCALVAAVGAAASLGPAWRASRLDPMRTLRCD